MRPHFHLRKPLFWPALLLLLGLTLWLDGGMAIAQTSPLHPTFSLLDQSGQNVLSSGEPVSTLQTCGVCHDTEFITDHSAHVSAGMDAFVAPGAGAAGLPWEMSSGLFGGWDRLTYRYLTPQGDTTFDLGAPDWVKLYGVRHVGGGPAMYSPDGTLLTEMAAVEGDPATHSSDPATGRPVPWDWQQSGVEEMNCFLCHLPTPNQSARAAELQAGRFRWANTATLLGTGIVLQEQDGWSWNPDAFEANGELAPALVTVQDPSSANCGLCHGVVHDSPAPLTPADLRDNGWLTQRTGQLFSGQRLQDTGLNLADKENLSRSWDVHAERNVECTDCHFSLNNPVYYQESEASRPEHLAFDPRRLDLGEYLLRPDHNFARGQAAPASVASASSTTMRRCESCHTTETMHEWLPYKNVHLDTLSCESCHIPKLYAPAIEQIDWTVVQLDGSAKVTYRGVQGDVDDIHSLVTGFEPVLLTRRAEHGDSLLMPFNLITTFYWVTGDPERPVRSQDLRAAYLEGSSYQADILAEFDGDGDGQLDETELRLDNEAKVALVRNRLLGLGLTDPQIRADVQPYNINHNVAYGGDAIRECKTCHNEASRISRSFLLASYVPGNVTPQFVSTANVELAGALVQDDVGVLRFEPATLAQGLYVPGHNRVDWVGRAGLLALLATLAGVVVHGGLRLRQARSLAHDPRHTPTLAAVYMYSMYERAWHWLQALTILLLLATGIIIHRPDTLGGLDLGLVVPVHNVLAAILVANALFSAFYHFASGEIRQYLPEPHGYFRQALLQTEYYLRGIFRGEPHPFQKTPTHKLNPLQQATYLVVLNLLLPLQILTGLAMWGAQHYPDFTVRLGGLPWLAPFHTLIAWLFASFLVLHIYLTTTGRTPMANIKAMTIGWEEIEGILPAGEQTRARDQQTAIGKEQTIS